MFSGKIKIFVKNNRLNIFYISETIKVKRLIFSHMINNKQMQNFQTKTNRKK